MHINLYNKFLKDYYNLLVKEHDREFIKKGELIERRTGRHIVIENYIPRFIRAGYCESFGFQWEKFKDLQLDSKNGRSFSRDKIVKNSKWELSKMSGKSVLEAGAGPGRFTEIFAGSGADIVAIEMSAAIDVNLENCGRRENLLLLQADIDNPSFLKEKFDFVFCYGVLQHTPEPEKTFKNLVDYLKPGGRISIDIYRKRLLPTCFSTPKYLWRPITKRLPRKTLLRILEWYIPKYIDFDTLIKKIPKIGYILTGLIPVPCWNYTQSDYSREERIKHALMDTFDALSAAYDFPQTKPKVNKWFKEANLKNVEVFFGSNGIVGNAAKKSLLS